MTNKFLSQLDEAIRESTKRFGETVFEQALESFLNNSDKNFDQLQQMQNGIFHIYYRKH